jgi:hypothetical protein
MAAKQIGSDNMDPGSLARTKYRRLEPTLTSLPALFSDDGIVEMSQSRSAQLFLYIARCYPDVIQSSGDAD